MTEFYILNEPHYKSYRNQYGEPAKEKESINVNIKKWLDGNPDYLPYGETKIIDDRMIQPFVKYTNRLSDKFLEMLIDEIKLIPEVGTAYNQALERFNNAKSSTQVQQAIAKGGKNKKSKKTRKHRKN